MKPEIGIASDHAGFELKAWLMSEDFGMAWHDLGTNTTQSVDYPDYAATLAQWLKQNPARKGILICGSGIGMSMAANRYAWVRAALCRHGLEARLSRQHNDANVLCLGARLIGVEVARDCVQNFLATAFEGGRHAGRITKLSNLNKE